MRIGIDICSTGKIMQALARSPFLKEEVFSPAEIAYCDAQPKPPQHYGGRWAAKEACLKAFGLSVLGVELNQIEVVHGDQSRPALRIHDSQLQERMNAEVGAFTLQVSITHEDDYSAAVVLVVTQ